MAELRSLPHMFNRWTIPSRTANDPGRSASIELVDIPNKTVDAGHVAIKSGGPSIGLVLGSGAARGFAHIGVMRALQERGIKPDIIVGTSMGALVGGCFATDQLDTLEEWARSLTMRRIIGYLDVRIGGSGLIGGGRLANRLQDSIGEMAIEDLPVRFAAIATEIGTGHEVWLTRGSLSLAVRASYALPGIFPPVHLGGRWLVDGALVNPVPVSAARALGARVVIAVNMDADRFGRGTTIASHGSMPGEAPPFRRTIIPAMASRACAACLTPSARSSDKLSPAIAGRVSPPSWWSCSTSCKTVSPECGSPAIRLTSISRRGSAISAGSISIAPPNPSPLAGRPPKRQWIRLPKPLPISADPRSLRR